MGLFDKLRVANQQVEQQETRDNIKKLKGRIIKINDKGYGFISCKDIPFTRIFFHWSALTKDTLNFQELRVGMHVEFEPTEIEGKGYRALHVRVVD